MYLTPKISERMIQADHRHHRGQITDSLVHLLAFICPMLTGSILPLVQILAYNKMDLPDSSDYWPDIKASLEAAGVPPGLMFPISAVTGQGVVDLIRLVHSALDELPAEVTLPNLQCC